MIIAQPLHSIVETYADGTLYLPAYAWPGGYPLVYYDKYASMMCVRCANSALNDLNDPLGAPIGVEIIEDDSDVQCERCDIWCGDL